MPGLVDSRLNLIAVVREALSVSPQRLANGLFLEDRCALPDQTSLFSASDGRAFVLANRDWDSADKREIAVFIFGITANDSPHGTPLDASNARSFGLLVGREVRPALSSSNRRPHLGPDRQGFALRTLVFLCFFPLFVFRQAVPLSRNAQ
jgi:hypothetical protein